MFLFLLILFVFLNGCADTEVIYKDSELFNDSDAELMECPDDMAEVGNICVDKYEASRSDATASTQGTATDKAISRKGVMPWMENPVTDSSYSSFKSACESAGKKLCKDPEWLGACSGPEKTVYSWGDKYDRELCNNVDVFCDDHCEEASIEECNTGADCGYEYQCFKPLPTGSFENCKNFAGAFDINGNVWEIADTGNGYVIRGGAFNCANAAARFECNFSAGWKELYAGFRCCKER